MVSKPVQDLVRKALHKALHEGHPDSDTMFDDAPHLARHRGEIDAASHDARQAIAMLIDRLNDCYALLNNRFQAAMAVSDFGAADALKAVMDMTALTLVGLQREVIELYEADAAAAANALAPVIADLAEASEDSGSNIEVAGRVKTVIGALAAVLGLA